MSDVDFAGHYGPWAIIAGGSEGVGSAFAERLAEQSLKLLLIARKPGPLQETANSIREKYGTEVRTLALDLTGADAVAAITDAVRGSEVGLLIYNAGAESKSRYFLDRPLDESERMVMLNVMTPMRLVHHFGAEMAARGKGGIVLCSSLAALAGCPGLAMYSGAKAFMDLFAETIWIELGDRGVDVLCAVLPLVHTPAAERMGLKFDGEMKGADPADIADEVLAHIRKGPVLHAGGSTDHAMHLRSLTRDQAVHSMMGMTASTNAAPTD